MPLKFGVCSAFAATLFGLALTTMPALAYVEAGTLNCRSPGASGYIVFSTRVFDCVFTPASGAPLQRYQGTVQRFGAQIGFTNDAVLGWAVFAATSRPGPGALAGGYVGASGGATVPGGVSCLSLQIVATTVARVDIHSLTGVNLRGPAPQGRRACLSQAPIQHV
jgi:hypothetical protein